MAAQIRMFSARMSKTQMLHYYGRARCTVHKAQGGGYVASGDWSDWDSWGPTRRQARAAWRKARRGDGE